MDTRRDFIKKAALLSGAGMLTALHGSIERAMAIAPEPGRTFLDAEHVVNLMQDNRSVDHFVGSLRGLFRGQDEHEARGRGVEVEVVPVIAVARAEDRAKERLVGHQA